MTNPPWHGAEEADFMPHIRRQFADYLPVRIERARSAVTRLRNDPGAHPEACDEIYSVAHDLAGTAGALGGAALGEATVALLRISRPLSQLDSPPSADEVNALEAAVAELVGSADEFLRWME